MAPKTFPNAYDDGNPTHSLPLGPLRSSTPAEQERPPVRDAQSAGDMQAIPDQSSAHSILSGSQGMEWEKHRHWVKKHSRNKIVWDVDPARIIQAVRIHGHEDLPETSFPPRGAREDDPPSYDPQKNALAQWIQANQKTKSYQPLATKVNSLLELVDGSIYTPNPEIDLRVCRTLVMKSYERLELVDSVEDFKKVYVDVVRARYWVWRTTRTLHRHISTNNVMWYRRSDGNVIGILCD
ncbi:hypothetical protein EVJ58_g9158 [Rhodofomes roseus]|uniref:Uncharacterized protein n=1 Tax=Rhodofomes roseus TaxID=34475 RepID=A0A4Y9XZA7_9APHY|nr:hypothetical protein EVJ58_g9158 [Rhodofomes roseus]